MADIHPTAIIAPGAKLGKGVKVDAYAVIASPHVTLEDNVRIKSHVYLDGHVRVGKGTTIWPFASIGTEAQDLKYHGEVTYVDIGENCQIREYVTINSSCGEGSTVKIGDGCLLMAYAHVAHNCTVGDGVIMANGATLAGHVVVGKRAILGGVCAIHQHVRIGDFAMVGGGSMVGMDVPPYSIGSGFPLKIIGLNIIGLKRHKFSLELRKDLIRAFRITFQEGLCWNDAKQQILEEITPSDELLNWVDFCSASIRGLAHYRSKRKMSKELALECVDV